jgi:hypothetical protein
MSLAMVDLPEPDSPARTKTSPCFSENETSSTAFTIEVFELKRLFFTKYFLRPSTLNQFKQDHIKASLMKYLLA